ncbi:MAG: hypothetical protein RIT27_1258 [Pseudomonadota bacterium]|jgi:uncharacterized membrane protein YfcA
MELNTIFLLGISFFAGLVDAIAGGGGLLLLPALLTVGIPPHLALGTNKLSATFGSFTASRICIIKGMVQPRFWLIMIFSTLQGSFLGALTAWLLSPEWLKKGLSIVIFGAATYILLKRPHIQNNTLQPLAFAPRGKSILLGHLLGFYDGIAGPGVGSFWTMANMTFFDLNLVEASCLARLMNFVSNVVALITFLAVGNVDIGLGLTLGTTLMIGAYLGAHSALKYGAALIRPLFIAMFVLLGTRLCWQVFFH